MEMKNEPVLNSNIIQEINEDIKAILDEIEPLIELNNPCPNNDNELIHNNAAFLKMLDSIFESKK